MSTFKVLMYDAKSYDIRGFEEKLKSLNLNSRIHIEFSGEPLSLASAPLAKGYDCVCIFVNDSCDADIIRCLAKHNIKLIALRCAGFNNVDILEALKHNMKIVRVPAYSPYAVAEYSAALLLTLNRKLHFAHNRVMINNFSLEGLVGFDLYGKTVGIVGTGKIGKCAISVFKGFGCRILAFDVYEDKKAEKEMDFKYTTLDELFKESDIISLYAPLTKDNYHMIGKENIPKMKKGVYIINTGRGPLIDAEALVKYLKNGHIGGACLDVYENEKGLFYNDCSSQIIQDDVLARLISLPNVLITSHQAYLTKEALDGIAGTTLNNILAFMEGKHLENEVTSP